MEGPRPLTAGVSEFKVKLILLFLLTLASVVMVSSVMAALHLFSDEFARAESYASVTSGLGSVLLLAITGWYAYETNRLVRIRQNEREREPDELRIALSREIGSMTGFGKSADNLSIWMQRATEMGSFGKTTIYEQNADNLGRLSPEEVDTIVSFYSHLDHLHQLIDTHANSELDATSTISDTLRTLDENQEKAISEMKEHYGRDDSIFVDINHETD